MSDRSAPNPMKQSAGGARRCARCERRALYRREGEDLCGTCYRADVPVEARPTVVPDRTPGADIPLHALARGNWAHIARIPREPKSEE